MGQGSRDQARYKELDLRLRTILPEEYQDCYEDVEPVSMGSAPLKLGRDGKVAWDEMWESFCDLAMAGGPPHKGMLLEPGSLAAIDAQPNRYQEAVQEICRGIALTTELAAAPSPFAGWVRVECGNLGSAEWLLRAIVMENISAHTVGTALHLPAGPDYRVEKEVKNVITAVSKTCHYWFDHMSDREQKTVENLFAKMGKESPLIQPPISGYGVRATDLQLLCDSMAGTILRLTGLRTSSHKYAGWLGVECPDVHAAIWLMRAMVVSNVLSRREGTTLFVPINPVRDPGGQVVVSTLATVWGFAVERKVLRDLSPSSLR